MMMKLQTFYKNSISFSMEQDIENLINEKVKEYDNNNTNIIDSALNSYIGIEALYEKDCKILRKSLCEITKHIIENCLPEYYRKTNEFEQIDKSSKNSKELQIQNYKEYENFLENFLETYFKNYFDQNPINDNISHEDQLDIQRTIHQYLMNLKDEISRKLNEIKQKIKNLSRQNHFIEFIFAIWKIIKNHPFSFGFGTIAVILILILLIYYILNNNNENFFA